MFNKNASYDPNSLSYAIENANDPTKLEKAIAAKIQEYENSGRLDRRESWLSSIFGGLGPHTSAEGSGIMALGAKAINAVRPGSVDYKLTPTVHMGSDDTLTELAADITNQSPEFLKEKRPEEMKRFNDLVAAHEILEAEAMTENLPGITNITGAAGLGGIAGAAAGAMDDVSVNAMRESIEALIPKLKQHQGLTKWLSRGLSGASNIGLGLLAGGLVGQGYNWLTGTPGIEKKWSSHMSADIPRLESKMLNVFQDPAMNELFRSMRGATGERRTFQEAVGHDIGEDIDKTKLEDLQKADPFQHYRGI